MGLTGIIAAQLLQAHPETGLAILERDYCVGGVWSERTSSETSVRTSLTFYKTDLSQLLDAMDTWYYRVLRYAYGTATGRGLYVRLVPCQVYNKVS